MQNIKITLLLVAVTAFTATATSPGDSTARHRTLRPVEVMGVKQDAAVESSVAAVTLVRGEQLRRLGINAAKGLSEIAPNFFAPDYGSRMTSSKIGRAHV